MQDHELACLSADGTGVPDALISSNLGTSFSAPLVARVAAGVLAEYPDTGANLIRALVLQSSDQLVTEFATPNDDLGERGLSNLRRRLVGYGQARLDHAIHSSDHRAVLVAADEIEVDGVHLYEIPIPDSFFEPRGERGITVSLSYAPDTRARRLDYLSSRMKFELVRGLDADDVVALFLAEPEDFGDDEAPPNEAEEVPEEGVEAERPRARLSDLGRRERPHLDPSTRVRSAGTNQHGRITFKRPLRREDGESFLLVIQDTNRWAPAGSMQPYAVAVCVWRTEGEAEVYVQLEAELTLQARILVEAELEASR